MSSSGADNDLKVRAALLKTEGNTFFVAKKWIKAQSKFTEAIELDKENAVLYSNRAACCLQLGRYMDAITDAKEAVRLDPEYAKGWGRLGTGYDRLKMYKDSVDAWESAVAAFSTSDTSAAAVRQRKEYEDKLRDAKAALQEYPKKHELRKVRLPDDGNSLPWDRAATMMPDLRQRLPESARSSAWVIDTASFWFNKGVNLMYQTRVIDTPDKVYTAGPSGALQDISNGILRDKRIFHGSTPNWMDIYDQQVKHEMIMYQAWGDSGPDQVMKKALARQLRDGWDKTRPALQTTLRAWILNGYFACTIVGDYEKGHEFLTRAVEVIEWGRDVWKDVASDDRGRTFDLHILRAVKSLRLDASFNLYGKDPDSDLVSLGSLMEDAQDLIDEVEADPRQPGSDPGYYLSFWDYISGEAYAVKAYCHCELANKAREKADAEASGEHWAKAVDMYIKAAFCFPEDDEKYACFLQCALRYMLDVGAELGMIKDVTKKMKDSMPKMLKIWQNSTRGGKGRDEELKAYIQRASALTAEE